MAEVYQFSVVDADLDWTPGQEAFGKIWEHGFDLLRFHRGDGFTIREESQDPGPKRRLDDIRDFLEPQIKGAHLDRVFVVRALKDQFAIRFRRHEVADPIPDRLIAVMASLKGAPYVFGGLDCSGLVLRAVEQVTGIVLPHRANDMFHHPLMLPLPWDQIQKGDFVFADRDSQGTVHHIATFDGKLDPYPGGPVVWDTEPSDTGSPSGWPTPMLGTGVQIRPVFANYYCNAYRVGCARMKAINGAV